MGFRGALLLLFEWNCVQPTCSPKFISIWAVNAQVLSTKGNGGLDTQGTATRVEVAQMLMNFVEHVG